LLDAASLNHYSNKESDKEEVLEGFGYLSELDPNYQGNLKFVVEKQLPRRGRSVLADGSGGEEQSARDHVDSGENGMPQEGHPLECPDDESREVLKLLSSRENLIRPFGRLVEEEESPIIDVELLGSISYLPPGLLPFPC
jgi:hypothetical protein